jgi:glucose/arabinose dehydrogenase
MAPDHCFEPPEPQYSGHFPRGDPGVADPSSTPNFVSDRTRGGHLHPVVWLGSLGLALALFGLSGCGSDSKPVGSSTGQSASGAASSATGQSASGSTSGAGSGTSTASGVLPSSRLVAIGAGLMGPLGLRATVYAQGPPTTATFAFDPHGRLWLTAAGLETHTQDGVYVITKAGAPAQKVVSELNDPLGLDWYAGKLYVSSTERVDAYWNFNGSRFTQHRRILNGPLPEGENNMLVTAPDGRFVMGVSATCDHCAPKSKWDGAIVTFRPDGSDLRLYASHIRAPVGLAYFPGTSDLFVSMNQQDNLGALTPGDWLANVKEGQDWRFPECYGQGGAACVGAPKPVAELDRHAAVGGVAITTGQFGPGVGTSALVAEWQSAKVLRVALTKTGSRYDGAVSPFLTGMRNPLALAIAPDRSLLAGDWATGTIYRIAATT